MVSERSIGYFETRVDWRILKSDNSDERVEVLAWRLRRL